MNICELELNIFAGVHANIIACWEHVFFHYQGENIIIVFLPEFELSSGESQAYIAGDSKIPHQTKCYNDVLDFYT